MFWKRKEESKAEGLVWFRYAIMLPDMEDTESELTIIGNLIIKNTGNKILNNPMICIRTKPTQEVRLGGKIGSEKHTALMVDGTNTESWQYVHDNWKKRTIETGEHWLKPNQCKQLETGESISFAHELRILTNSQEKFLMVDGFFYCEEINSGIPALNNITINF